MAGKYHKYHKCFLKMILKNSQWDQNSSWKLKIWCIVLVFESLCPVRTVWWGVVWPYLPFLGSVSTWTVDMYAAAAAASRGRWQYLAPERGALSAENNCIIQVFSLSDQIYAARWKYLYKLAVHENHQSAVTDETNFLYFSRLQGKNCACTYISGDCGNITLFLCPIRLLIINHSHRQCSWRPMTYDNHPTSLPGLRLIWVDLQCPKMY